LWCQAYSGEVFAESSFKNVTSQFNVKNYELNRPNTLGAIVKGSPLNNCGHFGFSLAFFFTESQVCVAMVDLPFLQDIKLFETIHEGYSTTSVAWFDALVI